MTRYNPRKIEEKWQARWLREKIYEPDLKKAKRPFYNLMMFPYPSGEGLHVGHAYTFSGADIFGRLKRMQGYDVFQPIGYDSFGIHSENYALKIGQHPKDLMQKTTKRYEGQLKSLGIGYAWREELKTSDPEYYRWTQWIFLQLFKHGFAYRQKSPVNWCVSCKTVLADEQVVGGECERCGAKAVKKELEQWFFRITNYAGRLLENLGKIDWSPKIKIAQRNWIGKSEGAMIDFEVRTKEKPNFLILHGWTGRATKNFIPWLKSELEKKGYNVQAPELPNTDNPKESEQVTYVLKSCKIDNNTVIVGHSLGGVVAMKCIQGFNSPISGLVLIAPAIDPKFHNAQSRPFWKSFSWEDLDYKVLKKLTGFRTVLSDLAEVHRKDYLEHLARQIGASLMTGTAVKKHFTATVEPMILNVLTSSITVFTTRPDTLFGATYMVLASEHSLIEKLESRIKNYGEVKEYVRKAKSKTEEERITEGREKTGVELKGVKAINPANREEIPVWVADYVLGRVGTGAIMAVPAHDQRDFEFAKKYDLPIKMVVCPHYPVKTCPVIDRAYEGEGYLVGSGKFDGTPSKEVRWEIVKFVDGTKKTQYRLRDWLISRQRYWGPPIPLIFCESCKKQAENPKFAAGDEPRHRLEIRNPKFSKGELENPGWIAVPEKELPVRLPYIKNFCPTGTEKSPLASVEKFYKVRCPKCKNWARRETDVSDTFLDSAWYYIGYLAKENSKFEIRNSKFRSRAKRWLPVDMYIGGAEHAVLHLLYVRFLSMVFHDWGLLNFEEPFKQFRAHGLLIKDGAKMSKSRGNVVNPDDYIRAYGADALRMYLMFLGPFEQGGDFGDTGIRGITRFLERVYKLIFNFQNSPSRRIHGLRPSEAKTFASDSIFKKNLKYQVQKILHKTIKKVTEDIENLQYNTAISALMVLLNAFEEHKDVVTQEDVKIFLKLLAPFAPHLTEELWENLHGSKKFKSIHHEKWPIFDPKLIKEDAFELVIQVNGKVRGRVRLSVGATEAEAKKVALALDSIKQYIKTEPRKVIFVPDKLINFVV